MSDGRDVEAFRTLAAPGLDEDDVFAAMYGLPGTGALWGEGRPAAFTPPPAGWHAEDARRARHAELMHRWPPVGGEGRIGPPPV